LAYQILTRLFPGADKNAVNCVKRLKNVPPESIALTLALVWLVSITLLRFSIDANSGTRDRLKVGYLPITCHLLLPVGMDRQVFFKRNVIPVKFTSWPDMIEAVKGGELDAAFILAPIALSLMDQGVPVQIALLGHRNGTGLVVSNSADIRDVTDLRNKIVAIPIRFSMQNLALLILLEKRGIDPNSVTRVELPPPDMPSALASKSIDGYIVGEPYATQAELMGAGRILKNASSIWPQFISSVVIVSKNSIRARKGLMDKLLKGLFAQGQWIETHRRQAAIIGARFFGLEPRLIKRVLLKKEVSYRNILPRSKEFQDIGKQMVRFRLVDRLPKVEIYNRWQ